MKPHRIFLVLVLVAAFSPSRVYSQRIESSTSLAQNWAFIENKGQLADENGKLLTDIPYYGTDHGVGIYCRKQSIAFVFHHISYKEKQAAEMIGLIAHSEAPVSADISTSRVELHFLGANSNCEIIASEPRKDYLNFYYQFTPENGITGVQKFENLLYRSIYKNIDLKLYVKSNGLKYEFIIHPGGNVNDIKMHWEGTVPELLQNGTVSYLSQLGYLSETAPIIYTETNKKLEGKFVKIDEHTLGFQLENSNFSETIIIDPHVTWATYLGGSAYDWAFGLDVDSNGKSVIGGYTSSATGIATAGAFQSSSPWGSDGFVSKFTSSEGLEWSTYFGGNYFDLFEKIAIDNSNNIIAFGHSNSDTGLTTLGTWQETKAGDQDLILVKFSPSGMRLWCTYVGEDSSEWAKDLALDPNGNIVIAARTNSFDMATTSAYQAYGRGVYEGYLGKFNDSGTRRIAATYFSGNGEDVISSVHCNKEGDIIITGRTNSDSFISTAGAHQQSLAGNKVWDWDAFIVKLDSNLETKKWGTYLGGNAMDWGFSSISDDSGYIYSAGETYSDSGIATPKAYKSKQGGAMTNFDGYLAKFNDTGKLIWATHFGGNDDEGISDLALNDAGRLFALGSTWGDTGIAVGNSCLSTHNGALDFFITSFSSTGFPIWSIYYGGPDVEAYGSLAAKSDSLYICGSTLSDSGIASTHGHQISRAGYYDACHAKIVNANYSYDTLDVTACTAYTHKGITYDNPGFYTQCFYYFNKCDSCILINLNIIRDTTHIYDTACYSYVWNKQTLTASGAYTQWLTAKDGCDSILILHLIMKKSSKQFLDVTTCDSFILNKVTYKTSGNYIQKTTNKAGCDSTIYLELKILKSSASYLNYAVCGNLEVNGITYTQSGQYTQMRNNYLACDSLIHLSVAITPESDTSITKKVCDSFTLNSSIYKSTGNYQQVVPNYLGCDSTIDLNLTVNYSTDHYIQSTGCGSISVNSIAYDKTGNYKQHYINPAGCDFNIWLDLTVLPLLKRTQNTRACNDYRSPSGKFLWTQSGTYTDTIHNSTGCDSLITVNLVIDSLGIGVTQTDGRTLKANASGFAYQWLDCQNNYTILTGETAQVFVAGVEGVYAVELRNSNCADTSRCFALTNLGTSTSTASRILVRPNPVNTGEALWVEFPCGRCTLQVTDLSGRQITIVNLENGTGKAVMSTPGIFLLSLQTESGKYHQWVEVR